MFAPTACCEAPLTCSALPLPPACSWAALEQLMREKKLRAAGVSNFNLEQMKKLLEVAQVKPALLQSNSGGAPGAGGWAPLLGAADEGCRVSERNPAAGAVSAQRSYGARTAIIAAQLWPFRLPPPLSALPHPDCRPAAAELGAAGLLSATRHPVPSILQPGRPVAGAVTGAPVRTPAVC